jgi:hypothetical protein
VWTLTSADRHKLQFGSREERTAFAATFPPEMYEAQIRDVLADDLALTPEMLDAIVEPKRQHIRESREVLVEQIEQINGHHADAPPFPPVDAYVDEPRARVNGARPAQREEDDEDAEKRRRPIAGPIDWSALKGAPPPRQWFHQDWLGAWPTLLAGSGGAGKTQLAQALCTALATGKRYVGDTARELRALAWFCEDDEDEIWRRQIPINAHFGVEMDDLIGRLNIVPRLGQENTLLNLAYGVPIFGGVYDELRQQVNDLKVDVLVLDNLAQVFGGSENDRHQVTYFVNGIAGLVHGRPFAPILLGHTARSQGSEFSGSAAWENACRMRWYLGAKLPDQKIDEDEPADTDTVYLARRKANYTSKDWRRLRYTDGVLVPDQPPPGVHFGQSYRDDAAEQALLHAFAHLKAMGVIPSDGRTSPDYLPKQIAAKRLAQAHTKHEMEQAMNRLMKAGRLRRDVVGKYSNRQPRYGLVIP